LPKLTKRLITDEKRRHGRMLVERYDREMFR
jgi:hypothetical protein